MDSMLGHGDAMGGTNYYTADGEVDYMIADTANDQSLLEPLGKDMMSRIRKTAKWSQLYQSGPSFPPKHKVLFIN